MISRFLDPSGQAYEQLGSSLVFSLRPFVRFCDCSCDFCKYHLLFLGILMN